MIRWLNTISVFLIYDEGIIRGAGEVGNHNHFREGLEGEEAMDSVKGSKVPAEQIFNLFIIVLIKNEQNCFGLWRHQGKLQEKSILCCLSILRMVY